MTMITIDISDELHQELLDVAGQLKINANETIQLALGYFLQAQSLTSVLEGTSRMSDGQALVDFPELKEEIGMDIKFHSKAMEELEALTEEEQVDVLEELITRITTPDEELEETLDLVIKEEQGTQIVLSEFYFGDVIYKIGQTVEIYHLALLEDEDESEADDNEEDEGEGEELEEDLFEEELAFEEKGNNVNH